MDKKIEHFLSLSSHYSDWDTTKYCQQINTLCNCTIEQLWLNKHSCFYLSFTYQNVITSICLVVHLCPAGHTVIRLFNLICIFSAVEKQHNIVALYWGNNLIITHSNVEYYSISKELVEEKQIRCVQVIAQVLHINTSTVVNMYHQLIYINTHMSLRFFCVCVFAQACMCVCLLFHLCSAGGWPYPPGSSDGPISSDGLCVF